MNPNDSAGQRPPGFPTPNSQNGPAPGTPGWPYGGLVSPQNTTPQNQGPPASDMPGTPPHPPYPYPYAMPVAAAAPAAPGTGGALATGAMPAPSPAPGTAASPPPVGGTPTWIMGPPKAVAVPAAPYNAGRAEGFLAIAALVLGFLFMRWGAFHSFEGWGVAVVTGLWLAVVLAYGRKQGAPGAEGLFWLAVAALCALSSALWAGSPWHPLRALLLLFAALYGAAVLFRVLIRDKTSNLFFFDGINLLFILPFRNLGYEWAGLKALRGERKPRGARAKRLLPVLAGLGLAAIVLAIVLPMLARADSGNFGRLLDDFTRWLRELDLDWNEVATTVAQLAVGIPLAFWLCGLLAGAAHKRHHKNIAAEGVEKGLASLRFLPGSTILIVLCLVSAAYALFIGCQLPYFFSALGGRVPEGYEVYSAYAREGFFELCRIAAINLGLLAVAGGLYRGKAHDAKALRAANIVLAGLTLLIILTACSKMGLYISVYGLTPKRVLTCVFMAFLAGVCIGVICRQFFRFSIVRVGLVLGAGLLCALCFVDTGGLIVRYNAGRYLAGSLDEFDEEVLYQCGPSGAPAAYAVYETLDGPGEIWARLRLYAVLTDQKLQAEQAAGTAADTLALARVRALDLPYNESDYLTGQSLLWDPHYARLDDMLM